MTHNQEKNQSVVKDTQSLKLELAEKDFIFFF